MFRESTLSTFFRVSILALAALVFAAQVPERCFAARGNSRSDSRRDDDRDDRTDRRSSRDNNQAAQDDSGSRDTRQAPVGQEAGEFSGMLQRAVGNISDGDVRAQSGIASRIARVQASPKLIRSIPHEALAERITDSASALRILDAVDEGDTRFQRVDGTWQTGRDGDANDAGQQAALAALNRLQETAASGDASASTAAEPSSEPVPSRDERLLARAQRYVRYGDAKLESGDDNAAATWFEAAYEINGGPEVAIRLAVVYEKLNLPNLALLHYQEASRLQRASEAVRQVAETQVLRLSTTVSEDGEALFDDLSGASADASDGYEDSFQEPTPPALSQPATGGEDSDAADGYEDTLAEAGPPAPSSPFSAAQPADIAKAFPADDLPSDGYGVVKQDPEYLADVERGKDCLQKQEWADAAAALSSAFDKVRKMSTANSLAFCYNRLQDYETAREFALTAKSLPAPTQEAVIDADRQLNFALQQLVLQGKASPAAKFEYAAQGVAKDPAMPDRMAGLGKLYSEAFAADPTIERAYLAGLNFMLQRDYERAAGMFRQVLGDPGAPPKNASEEEQQQFADGAALMKQMARRFLEQQGLPVDPKYEYVRKVDDKYAVARDPLSGERIASPLSGEEIRPFHNLHEALQEEIDLFLNKPGVTPQDTLKGIVKWTEHNVSITADPEALLAEHYVLKHRGDKTPDEIADLLEQDFGIEWDATQDIAEYSTPILDEMRSRKVEYLKSTAERNQYRLAEIEDSGLLTQGVDGDGEPRPLTTEGMVTAAAGRDWGIFVMDPDGKLYLHDHKVSLFHHSSFLAGAETAGAGEIKAKNGKITDVSNKSGHYAPATIQLVQTLKEIRDGLGQDLKDITVHVIGESGDGKFKARKWPRNAADFVRDFEEDRTAFKEEFQKLGFMNDPYAEGPVVAMAPAKPTDSYLDVQEPLQSTMTDAEQSLRQIGLNPGQRDWAVQFLESWKAQTDDENTDPQRLEKAAAITSYTGSLRPSGAPAELPENASPDDAARIAPQQFMQQREGWPAVKQAYERGEITKAGVDSLLAYRELLTRGLIARVNEGRPTDGQLKAAWSGSTTATSDIDVNLKGPDTESAVADLNRLFREEFGDGREAGVVWDVNFYAQDFLPEKVPKTKFDESADRSAWRSTAAKALKTPRLEQLAAVDRRNQLVASLLRARIDMGDDWQSYKRELARTPAGQSREFQDAIGAAEAAYEVREQRVGQAEAAVQSDASLPPAAKRGNNLTMAAENRVYERLLTEKVKPARQRYSDALAAIGTEATATDEQLETLAAAYVDLRKAQSEACAYANEAYLTEGSVVGVVANKQILGGGFKNKVPADRKNKLELGPHEYHDMANEQFGRIFHKIEQAEPGGDNANDAAEVMRQTGKYIHRWLNAAKHMHLAVAAEGAEPPVPESVRQHARDLEGLKKDVIPLKDAGGRETEFLPVDRQDLDAETRIAVQNTFQLPPEDMNASDYVQKHLPVIKEKLLRWQAAVNSQYVEYAGNALLAQGN